MMIFSLVKNVYVSNVIIICFVKKMGCENFYVFKI